MENESMDLSGAMDMLKNMLSDEEGQNQLKNIANMLRGDAPQRPESGNGGIDPENLDMILKIQKIMNTAKAQDQSQTQLLLALRPFLKPSRREKVDQAMKLMKYSGVLSMMQEMRGDG